MLPESIVRALTTTKVRQRRNGEWVGAVANTSFDVLETAQLMSLTYFRGRRDRPPWGVYSFGRRIEVTKHVSDYAIHYNITVSGDDGIAYFTQVRVWPTLQLLHQVQYPDAEEWN